MKNLRFLLLTVSLCTATAQEPSPPTLGSALANEISALEKSFLAIAEAMPEANYNFTPAGLNIPGGDFKGVRTFGTQLSHTAASNYAIWSGITGDKFPRDFMGGDGPANLRTKADILSFLRDSFALGHKAAASLTDQNMLQEVGKNGTRLHLIVFGITHAMDHYGQLVEYLRMNGITPPGS